MSKEPFYPVQVFWSDEDEGYIAIVPDLPGCSAFGDTAEEAIQESRPAIEAWLEAAREAGNRIPEPSKLPLNRNYSGKFLVRVPQTLHRQLVVVAEEEGVSLNQFVTFLLTDGLAHRETSPSDVSREPRHFVNYIADFACLHSADTKPLGSFNWCTAVASPPQARDLDDDDFKQPNYVVVSKGSLVRRATSG